MSEKKNKTKPKTKKPKNIFLPTEKKRKEGIEQFTENLQPHEREKYGEMFELFTQTISDRLTECDNNRDYFLILNIANKAFPRIFKAPNASFIEWIDTYGDEINSMSEERKNETRQYMFNKRIQRAYDISTIEAANEMGIPLDFDET